jgi:hypothetical protein
MTECERGSHCRRVAVAREVETDAVVNRIDVTVPWPDATPECN